MARIFSSLMLVLLIGACERDSLKELEDQQAALFRYVEEHPIGSSTDIWIEKLNMFGEWERTVLVFGYLDDFDVCRQIIEKTTPSQEKWRYRCLPAN